MAKLVRQDKTSLTMENPFGLPVRVFANEAVQIEAKAVEELERFLQVAQTVERIRRHDRSFFGSDDAAVVDIAVTPDFHKGRGIPIGTVIRTRGFVCPQAIGRDINCGMRLCATDLPAERVRANLPKIEGHIRHLFFEGGRHIPTRKVQRARGPRRPAGDARRGQG